MSSIYAWFVIGGLLIGPIGLFGGNPTIAAIGNAFFIAGFFTPVVFTRSLNLKEAVFGGIWTATVIYFAVDGLVSAPHLTLAIPLLIVSVLISKWSKTSFTVQQN